MMKSNLERMMILSLGLTLAFVPGGYGGTLASPSVPGGRAERSLKKLEVHPPRIELTTPHAYSQLIVTGIKDTGERVDVTREVTIEVPAGLVQVDNSALVRPVADGKGDLTIHLGKGNSGEFRYTARVPVTVSGQKEEYQVSFRQDVMPVLSRLGCNAGTCHGAAKGKNGFKLSLRGYDPLFDHLALTDDLEGRRFNRAAPDSSLMLLKMSGGVAHTGGVLSQPGQPYYELVRAWIAQGVKDQADSPKVTSISVLPQKPVIDLPGGTQQLAVTATYSDGSVRDVTREAFLQSSNTEVAEVDREAQVTAVRRGEATVLARYEGTYAATSLIVMGDRSGFVWKEPPTFNFIDQLVYKKLQRVKVLPSELCTDAEFIRRVYLDLTGLPPEPEVVRNFLADKRATQVKRDEVIDSLIGSPEFVEYWTNKWADLLMVNRKFLGVEGARAFRQYIHQSIADNKPYNQFAHEILNTSGSTIDHPAASYYKVHRDPTDLMENTTQLFLAIRFNCNKCHDHPFERWTQDQYYHLAAYFAQVVRKEDPHYKGKKVPGTAVQGATPLVEVISDAKTGEVTNYRTGQSAEPVFPFEHKGKIAEDASRREQLAEWVSAKENPYFARSYVNRLWSYLLGVGLIEPIDDIRAGNPPTNPELLDALTREFIDSGFDSQHIFRLICKSRVYQHSVQTNAWNEDDKINYSHALARRLPAEVLYDAIHQATGSLSKLPELPPGARAAELLDSTQEVPGRFLNLFGKPPRESACECERSDTMMLGPILNLVNGPVLADAIKDPNNRIARLLAGQKDSTTIVEDLYLAVLCRYPTPRELEIGLEALKEGQETYQRMLAEHNQRQKVLADYEKGLPARQAAWEAKIQKLPDWAPLEITRAVSKGGAVLATQKDGSVLASGKNPARDTYTITGQTDLKKITGIRLEVLPHPSLPAKGPGRPPNGNFVLTQLKVNAKARGTDGPAKPIVLHRPQATFAQANFPIANAIDNNPRSGWAIAPQFGKAHTAFFELQQPLALPEGGTLTIQMVQNYGGQHTLGHFRFSVTTTKPPLTFQGPPEAIAAVLKVPTDKRTPQQKAQLSNYYRAQDQELARLQRELADHPKPVDSRHPGAQDLVWALLNSKAFQFNH
jgi:hypothetical protein